MLSRLFPLTEAASFTVRALGTAAALCVLLTAIALIARRFRLARLGGLALALVCFAWLGLHLTRPAWLRWALAEQVPVPRATEPKWIEQRTGLETAEVEFFVGDERVDRLVLTRLDPRWFELKVAVDPSRSRTVEDWQAALGATAVINGSYFRPDGLPDTPLRIDGTPAGPIVYRSQHGAIVGDPPAILDLAGKDPLAEIEAYANAMVSYPLLVDANRDVRVTDHRDWLASRSFVGIDRAGRVVLGTTEAGFFTLRRFGEYLRDAPLDLKLALNLDGGPVASNLVKTDGFERVVVGHAEITDGSDVLRAWWQARRTSHWHLPIVLAAVARSERDAHAHQVQVR